MTQTLENSYKLFFLVISKIKNCLKCWGGRGLTIAGRIQIFKTLAISKTLHISIMRTPPTQFLEILNSIQKDLSGITHVPRLNIAAL